MRDGGMHSRFAELRGARACPSLATPLLPRPLLPRPLLPPLWRLDASSPHSLPADPLQGPRSSSSRCCAPSTRLASSSYLRRSAPSSSPQAASAPPALAPAPPRPLSGTKTTTPLQTTLTSLTTDSPRCRRSCGGVRRYAKKEEASFGLERLAAVYRAHTSASRTSCRFDESLDSACVRLTIFLERQHSHTHCDHIHLPQAQRSACAVRYFKRCQVRCLSQCCRSVLDTKARQRRRCESWTRPSACVAHVWAAASSLKYREMHRVGSVPSKRRFRAPCTVSFQSKVSVSSFGRTEGTLASQTSQRRWMKARRRGRSIGERSAFR